MQIVWLEPWEAVDDPEYCRGWEDQLKREVGPRHRLFGRSVKLIGRRFDTDDALFELDGGEVADVHLTWRMNPDPVSEWPAHGLWPSLEEWASNAMARDHADRQ